MTIPDQSLVFVGSSDQLLAIVVGLRALPFAFDAGAREASVPSPVVAAGMCATVASLAMEKDSGLEKSAMKVPEAQEAATELL